MTSLIRNICGLAALPASPSDRIELIPVGAFKTADRRSPFSLTDPAAVIAASLAAAPGNVLPIDFDHRSFGGQGQAESRAAGWITAMEVEGALIMASVEWTPAGRAAIEDRSYRFVSPTFRSRPDGRVMFIDGAGLVNNPALPQLRQLASKEDDIMNPIEQIAGVLGIAADKPDDIVARVTALAASETQLASIRTAAGVADDDGAVIQICSRLKSKAPDPSSFVPKASFDALQTQFASLQADVTQTKVDAALELAREEGKLTPDLEEWAVNLASKDLGEFEAWAKVAPARVNLGGPRLAGRKAPKVTASDGLDDLERQVASKMGVSEEQFLATRNAAQKDA